MKRVLVTGFTGLVGDGITRYPSIDGAPLPADDVAKLRGETPPEENGDK